VRGGLVGLLRDWLGFYGAALVSVARVYFPALSGRLLSCSLGTLFRKSNITVNAIEAYLSTRT
jgi:hypothetical protein